jgi:HSP20 family protein
MLGLRAFDRWFDEPWWRPFRFGAEEGGGLWATDMYETDDSIVLKVGMPGVTPEDVQISLTGNKLTIQGEMKADEEAKEDRYFRREHRYGRYQRSFTLPTTVQGDKADAVFENGVLKLTLPKSEEVKPKQIQVRGSKTIEGTAR